MKYPYNTHPAVIIAMVAFFGLTVLSILFSGLVAFKLVPFAKIMMLISFIMMASFILRAIIFEHRYGKVY